MELRVLKYFLMVAREENITKAAQLLHITQPTLSRQLMLLEEELGTRLFLRGRHNITLTDDGLLLKRRAQERHSLRRRMLLFSSAGRESMTLLSLKPQKGHFIRDLLILRRFSGGPRPYIRAPLVLPKALRGCPGNVRLYYITGISKWIEFCQIFLKKFCKAYVKQPLDKTYYNVL